ncbi:MAG: hypothetical protein FWB98_03270 [Defluviitaleaceae bacterium]|nr:hypothetical protein [Defluviitaleaceae bacterium]
MVTKQSILKKALEMANHNLYCVSANMLMTQPKAGKEADHAEYAAEAELLRAWLGELANADPVAKFERDLWDARDGYGNIEIITDRREEITKLQGEMSRLKKELAQIEEAAG